MTSAIARSLLALSESFAREALKGRCSYTVISTDYGSIVAVRVPTKSRTHALSICAWPSIPPKSWPGIGRAGYWLRAVRAIADATALAIGITKVEIVPSLRPGPVPVFTFDARDREQTVRLVRALLLSIA